MKFQTLRSYVESLTQSVAAHRLGVTQGYVSQTLSAGRAVYVAETLDGAVAVELKPYGQTQDAKARDTVHEIGDAKLVRR